MQRLVRDPITGPARPGLHGICIAEVSGLHDVLEPKIFQTCKWGKAEDWKLWKYVKKSSRNFLQVLIVFSGNFPSTIDIA